MDSFDKTWHLSKTEKESNLTEFELQLWRVFSGFMRWAEECERYVNGTKLTGHELAVLHIIRMKERPKSITDIARILNRTDTYNIQYSIKKLMRMNLIQKLVESPNYNKSTLYQITEAGIKNTDAYTQARRKILIDICTQDSTIKLAEITNAISKLKSIYYEAELAASINLGPENPIKIDKKDISKKTKINFNKTHKKVSNKQ